MGTGTADSQSAEGLLVKLPTRPLSTGSGNAYRACPCIPVFRMFDANFKDLRISIRALLKMNMVNNNRDRPANYLPDLVVVSLMVHLIKVGEALYFYEFQKFKARIESFLEGVSVDTKSLSAMNKFELRKDIKVHVVEGFFPFPNVGKKLSLLSLEAG